MSADLDRAALDRAALDRAALDRAALDAHTWAARARGALYGVSFAVRVTDPVHLASFQAEFPPGAEPCDPPVDRRFSVVPSSTPSGPVFDLYGGRRRVGRHPQLDGLARRFGTVVRHLIARRAEGRVFVHAGVVAIGSRAVLLPGRSFAGKSTLVAELVRAGATYCSDEYAVLDADGWVHPFPKPISLRVPDATVATRVDAGDLGGAVATTPLRVGAVVATQYRAGARWSPRPLSPGHAALHLLDNAVPARRRFPEVTAAISAALAGGIAGWEGPRGDAVEATRWILGHVPTEV